MARKSPAEIFAQIRDAIGAWEEFAPEAVFYGLTLAQFRAVARPSLRTRTEIENLNRRLRRTIQRRVVADARTMRLVQGVVSSVKGDPDHGEDSALYAAMGYVRKSARRKRRRKKK